MVVVRVRQDDRVEPSIPGRHVPIQDVEENAAVGAAVDQDPAAAVSLEEDRVALADVEDDHVDGAVGSRRDHAAGQRDDEGSRDEGAAVVGPAGRLLRASGATGARRRAGACASTG